MHTTPPPIRLREKRDFGDKINATFVFLRQNFIPLLRLILFVSLPLILIAAILMHIVSADLHSFLGGEETDSPLLHSHLLTLYSSPTFILLMLLTSVGLVAVMSVTYEFIHRYLQNRLPPSSIDAAWRSGLKYAPRFLLSSVINFLIFALFFFLIIFMFFLFSLLGNGGAIIGIFLIIILFFAGFILFCPLLLIYPIQVIEKTNYPRAFSRAFGLVKGRDWFATAGLICILALIYYFIQFVFSIPFQVINFTAAFHSLDAEPFTESMRWQMVLAYAVSLVGSFISLPVFWIGIAFQYFNLAEKKDQTGLIEEIEAIGT